MRLSILLWGFTLSLFPSLSLFFFVLSIKTPWSLLFLFIPASVFFFCFFLDFQHLLRLNMGLGIQKGTCEWAHPRLYTKSRTIA